MERESARSDVQPALGHGLPNDAAAAEEEEDG